MVISGEVELLHGRHGDRVHLLRTSEDRHRDQLLRDKTEDGHSYVIYTQNKGKCICCYKIYSVELYKVLPCHQ